MASASKSLTPQEDVAGSARTRSKARGYGGSLDAAAAPRRGTAIALSSCSGTLGRGCINSAAAPSPYATPCSQADIATVSHRALEGFKATCDDCRQTRLEHRTG